MNACTTTYGGFLTAGAARVGAACAAPAAHPGTLAPVHALPTTSVHVQVQGWQPIGGSEIATKQISTMFSTDRPHPRPPERSP